MLWSSLLALTTTTQQQGHFDDNTAATVARLLRPVVTLHTVYQIVRDQLIIYPAHALHLQDQYNELWHACDHGNFWNATMGSKCDGLLDDLVDELSRLNV